MGDRHGPAHQDEQPDPYRRHHDSVESLLYAQRPDWTRLASLIIGKGAALPGINQLGPRIVKGDFSRLLHPHFVKDMGIALLEARRMKLSLPGWLW